MNVRFMESLAIFSVFILFPSIAFPAHQFKEKVYQEVWCEKAKGTTEHVLEDRTRIDCLTNDYAVEVDFGTKWAESVGQALYYAEMTGRRPGVVLILENPDEDRYLQRLNRVANKFQIKVWTIAPSDLELPLPNEDQKSGAGTVRRPVAIR